MLDKLLACNAWIVYGRHVIAISELFSLLDGSPGPVDSGAAVVDLVHVGVARVVDQAAGEGQAQPNLCSWNPNFVIVGIENVKVGVVVESDQMKF